MHRPYLSLTTSRFVVLLPSAYDNRLIKYLHINSIIKKGMFLKVKGGKFNRPVQGRGSTKSRGRKFNRPVQGRGSTFRFGARSEGGQRVRSINRITSQGSHRYSRGGGGGGGHDTIVLQLFVYFLPAWWITGCPYFSLFL